MISELSYNGMNAHTGSRGVFANGTRARKIAAERSTTVETSARSRGPAGRPEGRTRGPATGGEAIGPGGTGRTSGASTASAIVKRICRRTARNGVLNRGRPEARGEDL